jgi:hypothetical protein
MSRRTITSGSPYEPILGISRAVVDGHHVAVSGTAPIMPNGVEPPVDGTDRRGGSSRSSSPRLPKSARAQSTSSVPARTSRCERLA